MTDIDGRIRDALSGHALTVPADEDAWRDIQTRLVSGRVAPGGVRFGRRLAVPGSGWWPAIGAGLVAALLIIGTVIGIRTSFQPEATYRSAGPRSVSPSPAPHCTPRAGGFINGSGLVSGVPVGSVSPTAAARQFVAGHGNWESAYGTPTSHWVVISNDGTYADVTDGRAILHTERVANGTWIVGSGGYCA